MVVNSLCKNMFLIFFGRFPVFSLSGKMDFQIPCFPGFPCAVATLYMCDMLYFHQVRIGENLSVVCVCVLGGGMGVLDSCVHKLTLLRIT